MDRGHQTALCAVVGCEEIASVACSIGVGHDAGLTVDYDIPVGLCDLHADGPRGAKPWNLTLDYARIDLPPELAALRGSE